MTSTASLDLARSLLGLLEMQTPTERLLVGVTNAHSGLTEAIGSWIEHLHPGISIIIAFDTKFDDCETYDRSMALLREPIGAVCDLNGTVAPAGHDILQIPITTIGDASAQKKTVVSRLHRLVLVKIPTRDNIKRRANDISIVTWDALLNDPPLAEKIVIGTNWIGRSPQ
ncbi:hypothetical protein FRB94_001194 [Tulasnella sp. JGI-2019a]|nr:hypothetical protein FRB93_010574 [Tulasnella sp. JGI-2019a]KAG9005782.1 hypothetical protein FRB94_001194 [Tulasnella sp. JGI-2019a]